MTIIEDQQAKYLIKSLQHHPSPYLIFCKDDGVEWMNQSAQYVFDTTEISDIGICLLYTSPSPRDPVSSRMPSSA